MSEQTSTSLSGRRFEESHLLDAARAVFHAEGYAAAQIADIARRAGTTKPTLYARLGNKEDIYLHVVRREAEIFRGWIADAYAHGSSLPLSELAQVGMDPLFRFAAERTEGFDLLFRGEKAGDQPGNLRREVLNNVTEQLTTLIKRRQKAFGADLGAPSDALAAACVGVALQVCEHTIDQGGDLGAARHIAARFVENAFHNLDVNPRPR
ncbi:TetR/AcrR family transcriptional regulator [Streptomyces melanosporofaciens]|uniref:DNA-binding transcriptional regulator, AcrR family n=1 Tax=Streptomyces melanosporofaciens TaxID=67327 RepID=A0A1H4KHM2_STRMJ|nr:TetR/AcrR family transcriptional regulator [Streptomyces melanosporofaciens]SEB58030.1 DNA-binding transcriptional regulator, AcrR family [Streptomyces melanosporofaciens]